MAMVRLAYDEETKNYLAKPTAQGKTKRDVTRCLKRHIAREVYWLLKNPAYEEVGPKRRIMRTAAHISLQQVADDFQLWPIKISRIERGLDHDDEFVAKYEAWLVDRTAA